MDKATWEESKSKNPGQQECANNADLLTLSLGALSLMSNRLLRCARASRSPGIDLGKRCFMITFHPNLMPKSMGTVLSHDLNIRPMKDGVGSCG